MAAIDKFIQNNQPKRKSKLADYQNDIIRLIDLKYTVAQIHDFLVVVKVEVSRDYLYKYIQKLKNNPALIESIKEVVLPEPKKETPIKSAAVKKMDNEEEKKVANADDIINYEADKDEDDMTADELKIHRQKQSARTSAMLNKLKENPDYGKERIVQEWKPTVKFT